MTLVANGGTSGTYSIVLVVSGTKTTNAVTDTSAAKSVTLASCPATSTFGVATLDSASSIKDCTGTNTLKGTKV